MDQKNKRTSQSVESILQVTKNMIQETDNFYDYYINKDNSLYHKQLPLLLRKSKLQALVIRNKENKKQMENNYPISLTKDINLLDNIRNAQIRSKKLPPLCPFYNDKGELVPSVVKTSRVYSSYNFDTDATNVTFSKKKVKKILKKILVRRDGDENQKIDFEKIENDYFNFANEEYKELNYDENNIFGKKEYYFNLIKNYIDNFINKEQIEENKEHKKERIFDKNRKKKKIILTLDSIKVQIYDKEKEKENTDENNNNNIINPIFEYNLPFDFLPFFYFKGEEKFKIFLSKIIEWDHINKKFILNENQGKIFQDILMNCSDFNKQLKAEKGKRNSQYKSDENIKQARAKFNSTVGNKKGIKNGTLLIKLPTQNFQNKEEQNYAQTMAGQGPNNYLSNLYGENNRFNVTDKKSIYPSEKENNYINYNVFEFLWLTPNNTFKVSIKMPLISVIIPKNNICVNKYIDFDLLFFLYENGFKYWDFYLAKYLTSFKSFRTLLEDINSVNESWNKRFYLTHPRIRAYSFNNFKIINIVSIKHSDILENLIDGLMAGNEDKKDNKIKTDKSIEKGKNNNNNDNANDNNNNIEKKEEPIQYTKAEEKIQNSTLIMKSFMAIVRFADIKTMKAQEFKIYFNFAQFIKFQKLEKFIDKISFLIKYIDINYLHKKASMNYKALDNFDENEWIKDYKRYNIHYLNTISNESKKEIHQTFAEFSGMSKNISIQIEIYHPLCLIRTLNDMGFIKTEKNILSNDNMSKTLSVEKDDIVNLSRIFYDNYGEEIIRNNNINSNGAK